MSTSAPAEVQKKKPSDLIQQINQMLDDALKARTTLTPERLAEYENRGKAAREERKMLEIRPAPTAQKSPVAVPTKKMEMTPIAVAAALNLADKFEGALTRAPPLGPKFSMKAWVEEGRA